MYAIIPAVLVAASEHIAKLAAGEGMAEHV